MTTPISNEVMRPAVGLTLVNPKAGTSTRFVATAESTGGDHVEIIATYPPNSGRPPLHLHPQQTEHFTVLGGVMHAIRGDEEVTLEVGDTLVIEPGTPHQMWAGADGARMRWRTTPALRTGELYCSTYQVARDNDWSPSGAQLLEILDDFQDEFCLC